MTFNPQPKRRYKNRKKCDELWTKCIKERAKYSSELSGIKGIKVGGMAILAAHHILGKDTNGKEHIFGVHNTNPAIASEYFDRIIFVIGEKRYKKIMLLKKARTGTSDLTLIKYYLTKKLKEFK